MPRFDHPNFGEAAKTTFVKGKIIRFEEDSDGKKTGLCTVKIGRSTYCSVPLFYHCRDRSELLINGSLKDAEKAFIVGEEIVIQVVGHIEDKVPCDDEDICSPLEGTSINDDGSVNVPLGGVPNILLDSGDGPLSANCGQNATLKMQCGPIGSQGGSQAEPADPPSSALECTVDLSNVETCRVLLGTGTDVDCSNREDLFSNLRLAPNNVSPIPEGEEECFYVDYISSCECVDGCTPGEILCTETLSNGLVINTVCPQGDAPTDDGSGISIVGPTNGQIAVDDTFEFTSNANENCICIWSTPDGESQGSSVSYTAPSSNSDCVANFTVSLTCICADEEGNLTSTTDSILISILENTSTDAAYQTGVIFDNVELILCNRHRDEFDCNGDFKSTVAVGQINSSNCTGHALCCQTFPTSDPGGRCNGGKVGKVCNLLCCDTGPDCEKWLNCCTFADPAELTWIDVRSANSKDTGCCPSGIGPISNTLPAGPC